MVESGAYLGASLDPSSFGVAFLQSTRRPLMLCPFFHSNTYFATVDDANVTNPKPRDRLFPRSYITTVSTVSPNCSKYFLKSPMLTCILTLVCILCQTSHKYLRTVMYLRPLNGRSWRDWDGLRSTRLLLIRKHSLSFLISASQLSQCHFVLTPRLLVWLKQRLGWLWWLTTRYWVISLWVFSFWNCSLNVNLKP